MPRPNRRRSDAAGLDAVRALGGHRREQGPDGTWNVREVPAARDADRAGRAYRCPGCDQLLPGAVPHVVVWPAEHLFGEAVAVGDRRHWHRSCWAARDRRRPR